MEVEPRRAMYVPWYIILNSKHPMLINDSGPLISYPKFHLDTSSAIVSVLLRSQWQLAIQSVESLCSRSIRHRSNTGSLHVVHLPNTSLRLRSRGSIFIIVVVRNIVDLIWEHGIDAESQIAEIDCPESALVKLRHM